MPKVNRLPKLTIKDSGSLVNINSKRKNLKIGRYVTLRQSNYPGKILFYRKYFLRIAKKRLESAIILLAKSLGLEINGFGVNIAHFFLNKI